MVRAEITHILERLRDGDQSAWNELAPLVYDQIKLQARRQLRNERPDPLHGTTMLVHEAFVRLMGEPGRNWRDRGHFYRVCGQVIRRVLVDSSRRRNALRRGGGAQIRLLDQDVPAPSNVNWEELDDALSRLAEISPRQAQVVDLRYFCGLSLEETALALELTVKTVQRDWVAARAWLFGVLSSGGS
jgi:RNA polymerase sigma factor (TIGR02999 family)